MKGHPTLHQKIDLPRFDETIKGGAEVFAAWTPAFEEISPEFFTDANGFDLMTRKVYDQEKLERFSASFFPVDSSITINDIGGLNSFTVWNDRP